MHLDRLTTTAGAARRRVLAHRRVLAALLVAVAVASGVRAATAPPPPSVPVLTAAHDLPAGSVLAADDLVAVAYAAGTPPSGATADADAVVGETLAAPLRRGEPVTDVRLVGPALTDPDPARSAVPVRLADAAAVALLQPGDRVDLVATDPEGSGSRLVVTDVPVLAVPAPAADAASGQPGALVVLGVPTSAVTRVSDAAVRYFLGYAFAH